MREAELIGRMQAQAEFNSMLVNDFTGLAITVNVLSSFVKEKLNISKEDWAKKFQDELVAWQKDAEEARKKQASRIVVPQGVPSGINLNKLKEEKK